MIGHPEPPRPRLVPEEYRLLRDLVNQHAGLQFDESVAYLFERRLAPRLAARGLASFHDYYQFLRFDREGMDELEEVVELLTTKETYFFRQEYQLRALADEILPKLSVELATGRRLCIWSAGCATGEEAYTLAITALASGLFEGWDVRVLGTDISPRSIATARRGRYKEGAFRATPEEIRRKYFVEQPEGHQVIEPVRRLCQFGQLNLLDAAKASIVGRVHVVVCRNVLIYLDLRSRKRVIESLYDRLVPGGYLLLGHSESLLNVSTAFELAHLEADLVYRKPVAAVRWDDQGR